MISRRGFLRGVAAAGAVAVIPSTLVLPTPEDIAAVERVGSLTWEPLPESVEPQPHLWPGMVIPIPRSQWGIYITNVNRFVSTIDVTTRDDMVRQFAYGLQETHVNGEVVKLR